MLQGRVVAIWRYPVSGLQGERIPQAKITKAGVAGDHLYVLRNLDSGRVMDPVSHSSSSGEVEGASQMLELSATMVGDPDGEHDVVITRAGEVLYSSAARADTGALSAALGHPVELVKYPRIVEARVRAGRTLHPITDASLGEMRRRYPAGDFDPRRFRPNMLMTVETGASGFAEQEWVGGDLDFGVVRLHVEKANVRCKVTTMKQDGVPEDEGILRTIQRENSSNLGVMCTVSAEGLVGVGDGASLAESRSEAAKLF